MVLRVEFPVPKLVGDEKRSFSARDVVANENLPQVANQEGISAAEHLVRRGNTFNREVLCLFIGHGVDKEA